MTTRPDKKDYYMRIAKEIAQRSTCLRAHTGAVIVKDDIIVSTGYNGAPRGEPNCCDIGTCKRKELAIEPGTRYELCNSVHAEANAIINAGRKASMGGDIYIVLMRLDGIPPKINNTPCIMCQRMIKNAGITNTYYLEQIGAEE